MQVHRLLSLIILIFIVSTGAVWAQSNGRIYTDDEIENIIQNEALNCNCPDTKERVVVQRQGSSGKVSLMLAGGGNYMYGAMNQGGDINLSSKLAGWQGEIMLGYSYRTYGGSGSTFGLFGRVGNTSADGLERFNTDAMINEGMVYEEQNLYYNIEGGVIIAEVLRISSGMGFQEYASLTSDMNRAAYYSTTAGLHLGSRNFKLLIEANFMYGRNLLETIIRPHIGLGIRL